MSTSVPTTEEFATLYPQFATDDLVGLVPSQLELSGKLLSVDAWQDFYSTAVSLDCAHCLALASIARQGGATGGLQAAVGPISSVSVAGISTGFATPSPDGKIPSEVWYGKTVYGQQFLRLRNACIPMGFMS